MGVPSSYRQFTDSSKKPMSLCAAQSMTEFISGSFLKKHNACPWDYSDAALNYKGIIRLDYAPVWFVVGLIYEKMLCASKNRPAFPDALKLLKTPATLKTGH